MKEDLTSPRQHFDTLVNLPVKAFLGDPGCEWKAKCAAHALTDLIEWTAQYRGAPSSGSGTPSESGASSSLAAFRDEMIQQCDAIRPVKDIADAARHRFLTRKGPQRVVLTATSAWYPDSNNLLLNAPDSKYHKKNFSEIVKEVKDFRDNWIRTNHP